MTSVSASYCPRRVTGWPESSILETFTREERLSCWSRRPFVQLREAVAIRARFLRRRRTMWLLAWRLKWQASHTRQRTRSVSRHWPEYYAWPRKGIHVVDEINSMSRDLDANQTVNKRTKVNILDGRMKHEATSSKLFYSTDELISRVSVHQENDMAQGG